MWVSWFVKCFVKRGCVYCDFVIGYDLAYIHWFMIYFYVYYIHTLEIGISIIYAIMFNFICCIDTHTFQDMANRPWLIPKCCMELSCNTSPGVFFQPLVCIPDTFDYSVYCLDVSHLVVVLHTTPVCAGSLLELKLQEGRWQLFVDNQSVALMRQADLSIYSDCCIIA